jgi:hypothetical protein
VSSVQIARISNNRRRRVVPGPRYPEQVFRGTSAALDRAPMKLFATFIAMFAAACTIDPVARAELSGTASGDAIFQQAGTSEQVSYRVVLDGPDGTYQVHLAATACGEASTRLEAIGTLELVAGTGTLRGVTEAWDVASGEPNDVVGKSLVVEQALAIQSCGTIFNSD